MAGFAHRGVPDGSVGLWRLPQAGFVIRAGGRTAIVDPWLTESDGIERVAPPPVRAGELPAADVVCCTHEHADHLDLETLRALPGRPPVVVPAALADEVAAAGLEPVGVAVGGPVEVAGVEVLATPARHVIREGSDDHYEVEPRALGYVLRFCGVAVFHSGDTLRVPGDADRLRRAGVDVALLPVNGRDWMREQQGLVGNMTGAEAAALAAEAGVPHLVPCHHDGVVGNTGGAAEAVAYAVANRLPLSVHVVGPGGLVVAP
jgi:L-ascorbate 6-phosphate lactonase